MTGSSSAAWPGFDASRSGALELVKVPFVFRQDDLLDTDGYIRAARERGHDLDLDLLYKLYIGGILVPLYRISEGRLRDPTEEGYSAAWPFRRPDGDNPKSWHNGFVYSSWQLVDLHDALRRYSVARTGHHIRRYQSDALRRRALLALCALSPRFFLDTR